LKCIIYFF